MENIAQTSIRKVKSWSYSRDRAKTLAKNPRVWHMTYHTAFHTKESERNESESFWRSTLSSSRQTILCGTVQNSSLQNNTKQKSIGSKFHNVFSTLIVWYGRLGVLAVFRKKNMNKNFKIYFHKMWFSHVGWKREVGGSELKVEIALWNCDPTPIEQHKSILVQLSHGQNDT